MNDLENENGHFPQKADIWSFGITLYAFATQKLPFYSKEEFELFSKVQEEDPIYPEYLSEKLVSFLTILLSKDPMK